MQYLTFSEIYTVLSKSFENVFKNVIVFFCLTFISLLHILRFNLTTINLIAIRLPYMQDYLVNEYDKQIETEEIMNDYADDNFEEINKSNESNEETDSHNYLTQGEIDFIKTINASNFPQKQVQVINVISNFLKRCDCNDCLTEIQEFIQEETDLIIKLQNIDTIQQPLNMSTNIDRSSPLVFTKN